MHYSLFPNFVLPSCMKNGLIGSEETTITWAHSIDPVSVWYIIQLKKTLKSQLSSSRRTQYIMWPNSLCIDVILLCLYDALDGRDTLAYFLTLSWMLKIKKMSGTTNVQWKKIFLMISSCFASKIIDDRN